MMKESICMLICLSACSKGYRSEWWLRSLNVMIRLCVVVRMLCSSGVKLRCNRLCSLCVRFFVSLLVFCILIARLMLDSVKSRLC